MIADAGRVIADLRALRELTEDANGAQRVAWTLMWLKEIGRAHV